MIDLGTVRPGTTIYIPFHTFDSNDPSASVTITGLAVTDIEVYKDGSTTQRGSDAGYSLLDTDGIDFDAITGIHGFSINLADNTTSGFWTAGSQYWVVVSAITVDAATISFVAATFRIGYPDAVINTTIAALSNQTSFTLTSGPAEDDALNGCIVLIHDIASAVQLGFAVVQDYTGASKTVTLVAGTTFTAAAGDNISVFAPRLLPTVLGRTLDVSSGGEAGVDWANVGSPTTAVNLSGTTVKTATDVETDTQDIQSRLPAALVSGRIDASVGAMAANVMTAAAAAADLATELNSAILAVLGALNDAASDGDPTTTDTMVAYLKQIINTLEGSAGIPTFPAAANPANAVSLAEVLRSIHANLGTPANLGGGATIAQNLSDIEAQTDDIGVAGAGLTAVPWNAAWDAEVESEATDALNAYDPPTRAELTSDINSVLARLRGIILANGTIGATGNDTTHVHISDFTYGNDEINNFLLVIFDNSESEYHARWIEDWVNASKLATVATLPFTPEASVDGYFLLPIRQDVTGGSGLDAAGVRAAVGLASANLDTQLAAIDDAVDTEVAAIKAKTDNLPTDPADQSAVETAITSAQNAILAVVGALADAAADGDPTSTDTLVAYIKQLVNVLVGSAGVVTFPASATPGNGVSLAEVLRQVYDETAGLNGGALLDAAGVRSAVGLAAANLDTQLDALPTAAENADAVWDEDATAHQTQGSFGQAVGDPAANSETLYKAIVTDPAGTNIAADLTAVKAKTDNLPTDPADESLLEAAITAAQTATIDGVLDGIRLSKNVAVSNFPFKMVDSTDHVTPETGLTVAATRSIDGAAFAACANSPVEIASGWYKIDLAAADLNGDVVILRFTAAGADTREIVIFTQPRD
jgi:hypothetical protein